MNLWFKKFSFSSFIGQFIIFFFFPFDFARLLSAVYRPIYAIRVEREMGPAVNLSRVLDDSPVSFDLTRFDFIESQLSSERPPDNLLSYISYILCLLLLSRLTGGEPFKCELGSSPARGCNDDSF